MRRSKPRVNESKSNPTSKKPKVYTNKKKDDVVEDIVRIVCRARKQMVGKAVESDVKRRLQVLRELCQNNLWHLSSKVLAKQWDVKREGKSVYAVADMILLRTCSENERLEVVQECIAAKHRRPDPAKEDEAHAAKYLASAMRRRHVGDDSGEQLTLSEVAEWNAVLKQLPTAEQPAWEEDWVLLQASESHQLHGNLNPRIYWRHKDKNEAALPQGLRTLRRALYADQKSEASSLIRRQLVTEDAVKWEEAIPKEVIWMG